MSEIQMTRIPIRTALAAAACVAAGAVMVPAASGSAAKPSKQVVKKVQVVDNLFAPTKLTVTKGNAVNWVWSNQNYNTHNVTLEKGPKGIKKSKYTSIDGTREIHFKVTFTTAGTYHFECTIHPDMVITVTVKK
jgi:plastocyanin